jgi:hypothetical protein
MKNFGRSTPEEIEQAKVTFTKDFGNVENFEREVWECKARSHLKRWPTIKSMTWAFLSMNVNKSYTHLARDLDGWCSKDATRRWLRRQSSFKTYRQHTRPGLTAKNKEAQKVFAKLVLDHLNMPEQKILWLKHDEKCFGA